MHWAALPLRSELPMLLYPSLSLLVTAVTLGATLAAAGLAYHRVRSWGWLVLLAALALLATRSLP